MDKSLIQSKSVWAAAIVAAVVAALGQFGIEVKAEHVALASLIVTSAMRYVTEGKITGLFKAKPA